MKFRNQNAMLVLLFPFALCIIFFFLFLKIYADNPSDGFFYLGLTLPFVVFGPFSVFYWFFFYNKIDEKYIRQRSIQSFKTFKKEMILAIYAIPIKDNKEKLLGYWITIVEKDEDYPNDDPNNLELIKWFLINEPEKTIRFHNSNYEKIIDHLTKCGYLVRYYPEPIDLGAKTD